MSAYYNENDPFAAEWLRSLILHDLIAEGDVDERSIEDVSADDLKPYVQCHFFAGIGVWSHALRRAGWPDDRPVWTGSCPCQPFSLAGAGLGFDDPRHLWPFWLRLIRQRRPDTILGEQVAAAGAWLDLVQADLEGEGFAVGAVDIPAAGFSGAHIRQRFKWVADRQIGGRGEERALAGRRLEGDRTEGTAPGPGAGCAAGGLALADGGNARAERQQRSGEQRQQQANGFPGGLDYSSSRRHGGEAGEVRAGRIGAELSGRDDGLGHHHPGPSVGSWTPDERGTVRLQGSAFGEASPLSGCDWLFCRDGKLRPVEPGTFPLAPTSPGRVGQLRAYGNAIDAEAATQFIGAYLDTFA